MNSYLSRIKARLNYVLYAIFLSRLGFGNRVSKDVWEEQYTDGTWNYLFSEDEAAHYFSICFQIKKYAKSFSILDIGCGNGVLYDYLSKNLNSALIYEGIDISENAVKAAKEKFHSAEFRKTDYDYEELTKKFDVLVFNETLYYFTKPMKTLEKAFSINLHADGFAVVSMCEDEKHNYLWERIGAKYKILAAETVENKKGQKWTIKTISTFQRGVK